MGEISLDSEGRMNQPLFSLMEIVDYIIQKLKRTIVWNKNERNAIDNIEKSNTIMSRERIFQ